MCNGCIWTAPVERHSHAQGLQMQQCYCTHTKLSIENANVLSCYPWAEQGSLTIAQIQLLSAPALVFPSCPACTQTHAPHFLHKHMSAGDRLCQHRIRGKTVAVLGSVFSPISLLFFPKWHSKWHSQWSHNSGRALQQHPCVREVRALEIEIPCCTG